ncbi:MAG: AAA family ATPase [Aeromicrobium sp.]
MTDQSAFRAQLARAMESATVVIEDCDLIAEDRDMIDSPHSMLFELLEAFDGLDGDANVTFLLTTNRPDLLERALAQRPGRIDLAVEIPLPEAGEGRALFTLDARVSDSLVTPLPRPLTRRSASPRRSRRSWSGARCRRPRSQIGP